MTEDTMKLASEIISRVLEETLDTAEAKELAAYVAGYFEGRQDAEKTADDERSAT